nr:E3 ubiquitin-protein ligase HERC2-like [Pongo abelii]
MPQHFIEAGLHWIKTLLIRGSVSLLANSVCLWFSSYNSFLDDSVESSGTKKEDLDDKEKKDETPAPVYRAKSILESWGCSWNTRHERARSIPLQDQHLALAILLELAVQRGTLSQMLSAILLLLQLWDSGAQETDNERSAQGTSAPLLPLLQRFQSIICRKDMPHSNGDIFCLAL